MYYVNILLYINWWSIIQEREGATCPNNRVTCHFSERRSREVEAAALAEVRTHAEEEVMYNILFLTARSGYFLFSSKLKL